MLHIKLKRITNAATLSQILCPQTPPPDAGDRVKRSNLICFRIKYAASLEQIFCPQTPTPHPDLLGSKGHNSTSSPRDYAAYQSKGNHEYSNVVANILPADLTLPHTPPLIPIPRPWGLVKRSKLIFPS